MTAVITGQQTGRALVSADLFHRLTSRLVREEGRQPELAERIMDQALAFLATSAHHPDEFLRPSKQVDIGWHAFVLHTADYANFCQRIAGGFIHHEPSDDECETHDSVDRTVQAIRDAGYVVDAALWDDIANCGETGCGAGRPPR